jgi:hypothetical protein
MQPEDEMGRGRQVGGEEDKLRLHCTLFCVCGLFDALSIYTELYRELLASSRLMARLDHNIVGLNGARRRLLKPQASFVSMSPADRGG